MIGADGGGFGRLDAAESEAVERAGGGATTDGGALIVAAELGDAADDDGVDAEDAGDLGGAVGVGAVAVGEVLFGEDLVELLAFDHGVDAVVHQLVYQDVGDALADVLIGPEQRGNAALHGGVIEIHHGDTLLLLARGAANQRQAKDKTRNSRHRSHVANHRPNPRLASTVPVLLTNDNGL